MPEACKPAIDIEIPYDGEIVRGWYQEWTWGMGNVNICFNGMSKQIPVPDSSLHDAAVAAFEELVSDNWLPKSYIPSSLPDDVQNAAFKYVNGLFESEDELVHARELVDAISINPDKNKSNRQIAWLCVNTMKAVLPAWTASCDDNVPTERLKQLIDHLNERTVIENWEPLCEPAIAMRAGQRIVDCVSCMVEPIADAIVNCAKFIRDNDPGAAANVLYLCDGAQSEGAWNCGDIRFAQWLVRTALPASIQCEELPDTKIYVV